MVVKYSQHISYNTVNLQSTKDSVWIFIYVGMKVRNIEFILVTKNSDLQILNKLETQRLFLTIS